MPSGPPLAVLRSLGPHRVHHLARRLHSAIHARHAACGRRQLGGARRQGFINGPSRVSGRAASGWSAAVVGRKSSKTVARAGEGDQCDCGAATVVGGSVAGEGPQPGSYVWKTRLLPAVKVRGLGSLTVNALTSAAGRGCPDNIRADHGMELRVLAEAAVRRGSVATGARCPGAA